MIHHLYNNSKKKKKVLMSKGPTFTITWILIWMYFHLRSPSSRQLCTQHSKATASL